MKRPVLILLILVFAFCNARANSDTTSVTDTSKNIVYVFSIKQDIAPPAWRLTQKSFEEAYALKANYIIIKLNTYGGMVNMGDSIRTKILESRIPVYFFITNNAASAGALIAIAADSIYMKKGAKIGSASVVDQSGKIMPEKYQSYMRSTMRATAEAHGKDTIIKGNDTIVKWHRDPVIAEAMVDPTIFIENISDTGKIVAFTANEAMENGYCEATLESIQEIIAHVGIKNHDIYEYKPTSLEKFIGFLISPAIQGILIM